jgi:hypothetical protein
MGWKREKILIYLFACLIVNCGFLKNVTTWASRVVQVVEHLLSKCETSSSTPSTAKKINK